MALRLSSAHPLAHSGGDFGRPNSGKSTLVVAVGRASPRFSLNIEPTGPTLYRYVDATKPTIAIQEADDLFTRKSDLKHIINAGWTRGPKIPRQVNIGGVLHTVEFDPFTPKAIDMLGHNLPPTTRTRCIELRMRPSSRLRRSNNSINLTMPSSPCCGASSRALLPTMPPR